VLDDVNVHEYSASEGILQKSITLRLTLLVLFVAVSVRLDFEQSVSRYLGSGPETSALAISENWRNPQVTYLALTKYL
jgi:hypothetical protein